MKKITYDIMLTKETVQALSLPEDAATLPFALLSASDMKDLPGLDFSDWKADMEDLGYAAEWDDTALLNHFAADFTDDLNRHAPDWGYARKVGNRNGEALYLVSICPCRKEGENMTAKNGNDWVLVTYLSGNDGPDIEGVYPTKGACQKAFANILQGIWPEGRNTDDEDHTKEECIDVLFFSDNERGNCLDVFVFQK